MLNPVPSTTLEQDHDRAAASRSPSALERKLGHHVAFSRAEREAIDRLLARDVRNLRGRSVLIEEGAAPREISVVVEGWACRYATLEDGRRQVVAFYLPGDVCDFDVFMMSHFDQSIAAIDGMRVAGISRSALSELSKSHPRISHAFWWESLAAAAIQRAWLINIGHRNALQRVAHLFSELVRRLEAIGRFDQDRCELPLTQNDIGEACSMTAVHTNRTIQALRKLGVIDLRQRTLGVLNRAALHDIADFEPSYLQLGDLPRRRGSERADQPPMPGALPTYHRL